MKKVLFAFTFLIAILSAPYMGYGAELKIKYHPQATIVWCWAATIAMVVEYVTGDSIEDCEVLSKYDRSLGGPGTCCYGDYRCIRTGQAKEMAHILENLFGVKGKYIPRPPSYNEIKNSIDNNHPLIAALQNPRTGSGHVVVISGYSNPQQVILLDPMNGRHVVNYQTVISNFQYGKWNSSFLITPESRDSSMNNSRRGRDDTDGPIRTPASECVTPFGSCYMNVPLPIGSECMCYYPTGGIPGIAH